MKINKKCKGDKHCKINSLGQKLKLLKQAKNNPTSTLELFYTKKSNKSSYQSKNERLLKIRKNANNPNAIAFDKWSLWVKK